MNNRKSFATKINEFFFGQPIPVLNEHDLEVIHRLDQKLDTLFDLLETQGLQPNPVDGLSDGSVAANDQRLDAEALEALTDQVRKLAKTQFKTNTLQENKNNQQQALIDELQKSLEQQEQRIADLNRQQQEAIRQTRLEVVETLLPLLDSLETAFDTGRRQVMKLPMPPTTRQAVIGWLDGLRLARLRLLDILQSHKVTAIPTVGQPFNPNHHVAVATDASGRVADGLIVSEDRAGYATEDKILRFAEVVVARSEGDRKN